MSDDVTEAFPLTWAIGWKREMCRHRARFGEHSIAECRDKILRELKLLGANRIVISSNLKLKNDGLPHSSQTQPDDRGVVVYFNLKGRQLCMPLDRWHTVEDNLWGIAQCIGAMRGIERWGVPQMVEAAFRGYTALPAPMTTAVRYFDDCTDKIQAESRYKELRKKLHPDLGGNANEFSEMMRQYKEVDEQ